MLRLPVGAEGLAASLPRSALVLRGEQRAWPRLSLAVFWFSVGSRGPGRVSPRLPVGAEGLAASLPRRALVLRVTVVTRFTPAHVISPTGYCDYFCFKQSFFLSQETGEKGFYIYSVSTLFTPLFRSKSPSDISFSFSLKNFL